MAVGAYLFTRLDTNSSSVDAIWSMVVAGAGLGLTLPTFMISVQNAFPHQMLGVVTASLQFSRNLGGAVGTAVLGSFLSMRLGGWTSDATLPEKAESLPPQVIGRLRDPQALMNPEAMAQIREMAQQGQGGAAALEAMVESLRGSLSTAMQDVFYLGLVITLLAVVATPFFKEIPLRKTLIETPGSLDTGNVNRNSL